MYSDVHVHRNVHKCISSLLTVCAAVSVKHLLVLSSNYRWRLATLLVSNENYCIVTRMICRCTLFALEPDVEGNVGLGPTGTTGNRNFCLEVNALYRSGCDIAPTSPTT
jgi:hypothetical protein